MTFPAGSYMDQNTRTEGEMKLALEDFLKAVKQVPGAGVTEQALTLATDAITPAAGAGGIISIDTEAAAAADNLANIVLTNVPDGSCLLLRIANNARVVTVKHLAGGSGQLSLRSAADLVMSATTQWLCVKRTGTLLEEQWRSGKEFLKSPTADSLTMTGGINGARGNIVQHATTMNPFATTSPDTLDGTGSAVTITDFVAAPQGGIHRTLYLIAGTIITHGGPITVDGNASYTVQAGDELELESVTTTTFRVHITKNDGTSVVASDATLATTDVTTNNVTSSKHGFAPKAPGDATKFLHGGATPAWSVPAGTLTAGTTLTRNPYAVSTLTTQAHGLGAEPSLYKVIMECLSADNSWVAGDRIIVGTLLGASAGNPAFVIYADATNVYLQTTNNAALLTPKTGAASFVITPSSWKVLVIPYIVN